MIAVGLGRKPRRQFFATRSVIKRGSWIARILKHETKKVGLLNARTQWVRVKCDPSNVHVHCVAKHG